MALILPTLRQHTVGGYSPEVDTTWHSLWWTEGTDFVANGYSDGADVSPWDNETGESNLTQATAGKKPHYRASHTALNSQPAVEFASASSQILQTAAFSVNPDYTAGVTIVMIFDGVGLGVADQCFDGIASGNRNLVGTNWSGGGEEWGWFAGSERFSSDSTQAASLLVSYFPGAAAVTHFMELDGTDISPADPGNDTLTGVSLGGKWNDSEYANIFYSLAGVFEGDFTADGSYADFTDWAETHYGLTIA